jgi:hypothetical protein
VATSLGDADNGDAEDGSVKVVLLVLLERATEAIECGTCERRKSSRRREVRRFTWASFEMFWIDIVSKREERYAWGGMHKSLSRGGIVGGTGGEILPVRGRDCDSSTSTKGKRPRYCQALECSIVP